MRNLMALLIVSLFVSMPIYADVNIYSARQENLIKPILDRFTEETDIQVNLVTGGADALITRMAREGVNSPADLLLTVDVGRLHRAKEQDLLSPVSSETLDNHVPSQYRDSQGYWYAMSLRSRIIVYSKERVDPAALNSYENLADTNWKGRICIRSSSNIYNQSLTASLIRHQGVEETEQWARGLVANMARPPQGGDRDQIRAVVAGQCDIAVVNSYYLAGMLSSAEAEQREVANQVAVFWPNQDGRGTHINISGAGVARHAPNRDAAIQLMEFLVNDASQQWYGKANGEFPIRADVPVSKVLQSWGSFKADEIALEQLGIHNAEAVRLMDRAGWR
jgi:iron(III) transport system substrate-binding protein